jgi:hypothetical protein
MTKPAFGSPRPQNLFRRRLSALADWTTIITTLGAAGIAAAGGWYGAENGGGVESAG